MHGAGGSGAQAASPFSPFLPPAPGPGAQVGGPPGSVAQVDITSARVDLGAVAGAVFGAGTGKTAPAGLSGGGRHGRWCRGRDAERG